IQPEAIDPKAEPEIADLLHQFVHRGIVEIQIRLMRIKAVPVIRFRNRVPRPVRGLKIFEDDARVFVFFRGVAPDIKLALGRTRWRAARFLEPGVLIGGMVDNELGNDAKPAVVRRSEKGTKVIKRAVVWINIEIIGDVVAVIFERRWIKRQEPDRADTQFLEIIELLDQAAEIADAIRVAVVKRLHVQLVNDGVLEPKRVRHDLKLFARGRARCNAELWRYHWTLF